jgi:hypothetical protein
LKEAMKDLMKQLEDGAAGLFKSLVSAITSAISSVACVVVEIALAAFGTFLDTAIQTSFPPIKAMGMSPMCITKAAKMAEKNAKAVKAGKVTKATKAADPTKATKAYNKFTTVESRARQITEKPKNQWRDIVESFHGLAKNPSRRGIVMFIWKLFVAIAQKIDNEALTKFIKSAMTKTIMWLMNVIWDALCGNFGTAMMSIVAQLIFCNWDLCIDKCAVEGFKFGKPTPEVEPWTDSPADLALIDAQPNPSNMIKALEDIDKSTASSVRTTCSNRPMDVRFGAKTAYGVVCDNPWCDAEKYDGHEFGVDDSVEQTATMHAVSLGGEGSGSHCDREHGCLKATEHDKCHSTNDVDVNWIGCYKRHFPLVHRGAFTVQACTEKCRGHGYMVSSRYRTGVGSWCSCGDKSQLPQRVQCGGGYHQMHTYRLGTNQCKLAKSEAKHVCQGWEKVREVRGASNGVACRALTVCIGFKSFPSANPPYPLRALCVPFARPFFPHVLHRCLVLWRGLQEKHRLVLCSERHEPAHRP